MTTLTVFTPTYNRAYTLERTYRSLCGQTCNDFEWLVVDDGSTDGTRELVQGFPILMGWYVCIKKKIKDDWYRTLCITYCLCNAFWVIVIRAAYSNRFAYLSWFMYPIIIAYPLINLPVWETQDRKTGIILLAYAGFTLFMQTIYW